jgi:cytochrome c oxidase subunit 2
MTALMTFMIISGIASTLGFGALVLLRDKNKITAMADLSATVTAELEIPAPHPIALDHPLVDIPLPFPELNMMPNMADKVGFAIQAGKPEIADMLIKVAKDTYFFTDVHSIASFGVGALGIWAATTLIFATWYTYCDAALPWQIGFQDPATAVMEAIINFHHDLFLFLVAVVVFVGWILARCIYLFEKEKNSKPDNFVHGPEIEVTWTLTPALILIFIAVPSFALLYSMDEVIDPELTVKAIGHQWYWAYEYSDLETKSGEDIAFDSYMCPDNEVVKGGFRLLETQLNMLLPVKTHVRLITTSADVIHSWAVPSFGVKLDACPGRLNQTSMFVKRLGRFFGQCSEICGVNHGFMPIAAAVLMPEDFMKAMAVKAERMGTELLIA